MPKNAGAESAERQNECVCSAGMGRAAGKEKSSLKTGQEATGRGAFVSRGTFCPRSVGMKMMRPEQSPDQTLSADRYVGLFALGFFFCHIFRGVSCASMKELDLPLQDSRAREGGQDPPAQPMDLPTFDSPHQEGAVITNYQPH